MRNREKLLDRRSQRESPAHQKLAESDADSAIVVAVEADGDA
jgi:hypothetical protein